MKMNNIYGNYWSEKQVIVKKITKSDRLPSAVLGDTIQAPAFMAIVRDEVPVKHIFVEIVPGTESTEVYIDLETGNTMTGLCAKVNIFYGETYKFEDMKLLRTESWPLKWFNLTNIPPVLNESYDAYERAMSVIGI